jgi:signal transduction histidine kinase/CheY-like chemotaxis protein
MAVGSIVAAVVLGRVVDDQEHRLLSDRAGEAAALVSSSFQGVSSTLPLLGAVTELDRGQAATLLSGVFRSSGSLVTAARDGDGFVVTTTTGDGPAVGAHLDGERVAVARRALENEGIVATLFTQSGERRLVFAGRTLPGVDHVVLQETRFQPSVLRRSAGDDFFPELDGAVYASATADADRLLLSTTDALPLSGDVVQRPIKIGADQWSLVVKARQPLVGGFTANAPWYLLAAGLLTSLLVAMLLDASRRRHAYALDLVDARTAELRDALAEQERLEEGQRRAREAAEEANRSKSEFLSRMSHELRTPLNAVLGFAQLLEVEELGDANHDSVRQIIRGGRHLLDLINEVLDITRIETGAFQLSPEPVLVSEALADVTALTGPLASQAGVHLVSGSSSRCNVHVLADRQRLNQILLNLISNAIKYNRPGGTVSVTCEPGDGATLRIGVHDTGPGIRPEHIDLLFTPFERLGAEQTTVEGTGIGLALSRRLAEAMGGTLDVDTTPGQGSTFWLTLPVVEAPVDRYERLHGGVTEPAAAPGRPIRTVLYIEDNLANLRLVERILASDPSVELVAAMQGRLGVDLAREHRPALILLDLHLPDLSGDEVLRQLRDDPATRGIPVAILSADATPGQVRRLLAEGAHSYLTKPLDVAELRQLVETVAGAPA